MFISPMMAHHEAALPLVVLIAPWIAFGYKVAIKFCRKAGKRGAK